MTTREFYVNVLNLIDVVVSDTPTDCVDTEALTAKAQELIAALDAKNEKRKNTETKEQKEAAARAAAVLAFLKEQTEPVTRDTIAGVLGMSPAQASAACKALGEAVTKTEIKVDKARKVAYSIA